MRPLAAALLLALLAPLPAQAQGATPPPFVEGLNRSFCHAAEDSASAWMNTLTADGGEVPYEMFGDPEATVPVVGIGVDPAADEAFEVRIPLSPALAQDLELNGTVSVQAYIGSGAYGGGSADIAVSLVAGGAQLGAAPAKAHTMTPKNSNAPQAGTTYDPISWSFAVPGSSIPAGTLLEWVFSGTVTAGNNIFLACHEARGRSYMELPVASAGPVKGGQAVFHDLSGAAPKINITSAAPLNATHVYNWTGPATPVRLALSGDRVAGNVSLRVRDGANTTLANLTFDGAALERTVTGAAGNWSIEVRLNGFAGNLTATLGAPPPATSGSGSPSPSPTSTSTRRPIPTPTRTPESEDTPPAALPLLLGAVALALAVRRRLR